MLRFIILGASALALGLSAGWVFVAGSLRLSRTATALPINIAKPAPYPRNTRPSRQVDSLDRRPATQQAKGMDWGQHGTPRIAAGSFGWLAQC